MSCSRPSKFRRFRSLGLLAACIIALSACQSYDPERSDSGTPIGNAGGSQRTPSNSARQPETLSEVVDALDQGRIEAAEAALLEIIDQQPGATLALRFLEQIQTDPLKLMGEAHDVVVVQPGDSLSGIAERELGDALQFFALARYNGIDAPRRMSPGIELRIPHSLKQPEEPLAVVESSMIEASPGVELDLPPGAGLTMAGRSLVESGRTAQAIALLSAGAEAGNLDSDGEELLAQATVQRAEALVAEGRQDDAVALLSEVSELLPPAGRHLLEPGLRTLEAREALVQGVRARRAGDLDEALALFERGLVLDPSNADLETEAANLRDLLVAKLHDQALIHYRDQELDRAIELWQRVEQLDPEFEPAQVYLERAVALRERLRALD